MGTGAHDIGSLAQRRRCCHEMLFKPLIDAPGSRIPAASGKVHRTRAKIKTEGTNNKPETNETTKHDLIQVRVADHTPSLDALKMCAKRACFHLH